MAYIGQGIKQGTFKVLDTSGNTYNGSNVTFSLGTQVGSASQLLVSHDGVIQKPGTDYSLATGGTQITFSTAPASGASIFIIEISGAVGGTVTPSDTSVTADKLNTALLTGQTDIGANIADADLFLIDDGAGGTLRKTAASRIKTYVGGFDVSSITGATALTTQPAATDEIVLSDAGTLKRLDIKHIQATPAFAAVPSSSTATAHNTYTKVQCDTETFDSDGTYDNSSNYRFTPAVAGKYFIYGMVAQGSGTGVNNMERQYTAIYKNGSKVVQTAHDGRNNAFGDTFSGTCAIILDLDGDDYVELYTKPLDGGSANCNYYTDSTCFGGFRITGVA